MTLTGTLRNKRQHSRIQHRSSEEFHGAEEPIAHSDSGQLISSPQVLLMDSEDITGRPHIGAGPAYYQVATPKSPHELSLGDDEYSGLRAEEGPLGRESEETERIKYEIAKREILEQLHLQVMIKHREMDDLEAESRGLGAKLEVLEMLHDDPELLAKVDAHQEQQAQLRLAQLEARRRREQQMAALPPAPLSSSSGGEYYYHTRSKSMNSHQGRSSTLRPADGNVIGLRVLGSKTVADASSPGTTSPPFSSFQQADPFAPQHFNQHHRRNYSSNCISSNSGVVGKTDSGDAIFRRLDGLLIVITCCKCGKSGFTSAQGIVNHSRLKHANSYSSQPLAVLHNQRILPEEQQNKIVMDKFKELHLDPQTEYLPNPTVVSQSPSSSANSNACITATEGRDISPTHISSSLSPTCVQPVSQFHSTKHLEKLYGKEGFQQIVDYVKESKDDLDVIMRVDSDIEDDPTPLHMEDQSDLLSQHNSERSTDLKRRASPNMDKALRERMRPAEKRVRPDAMALVELPAEEKRSSHYNLRARSKLKSLSKHE
ncbi:AAR111Cp [Eremothecium gossypii ATCC 10895]|uniref:AAR111Cp n=1 Tax=Eremothecium gossypii (strain ATCC 10895 / CBS 109.51 / FGSC 9923 / NRRL Y-1056) TaxID=284811 RepID=Q75EG7_EREGS|nr:AAR111Cp [Eremothecium gossypii ATCC 10895]AAS50477.1 AAR111Cp [Eremothecium gossypii ATCC 10895]AEY94764.1 FAAR111Cp [Eremothecium gossypii FDAG1]